MTLTKPDADQLVDELRHLIDRSRVRASAAINSELVLLYWEVGRRLRADVGDGDRATYGRQIVGSVARALTTAYGRGFERRNLYNMMRFAEMYPDETIVHALRAQLSWTHFRELVAIEDPLKRGYYTEMCRQER